MIWMAANGEAGALAPGSAAQFSAAEVASSAPDAPLSLGAAGDRGAVPCRYSQDPRLEHTRSDATCHCEVL